MKRNIFTVDMYIIFFLIPLKSFSQNLEETFAPRAEPLDDEVLYEWEEDDVIMKIVRYRIGVFKGALDGYHAPVRYSGHSIASVAAQSYTLDDVSSPRNVSWFLWGVGARRGLTYLENQAIVNADKLGVYGFYMGERLTVFTVADARVKAAAPSCGGISDFDKYNPIYNVCLADDVNLKEISCPTLFQGPSNDWHGQIEDLPNAVDYLKTDELRLVSAAHFSHNDLPASEVTGLLWMKKQLKESFIFPETPESILKLNTDNGVPTFTVTPDDSKTILSVDVYYTQQTEYPSDITERIHSTNRFWHYASTVKNGNQYIANLPLTTTEQSLRCYANVVYALDEPVEGAGYSFRIYETKKFNLSTLIHQSSVTDLTSANAVVTLSRTKVIEDFEANWGKEWFTNDVDGWDRKIHKVYNDVYEAPIDAQLVLDVKSEQNNTLEIEIDSYSKKVQIVGGNNWQTITLSISNFLQNSGNQLSSWQDIYTLSHGGSSNWSGNDPEFRNLHWVGDTYVSNTNIAESGEASQSSTLSTGEATNAIDGNTSGVWSQGSVTHTSAETNAWWQVDLKSESTIGDIVIYNRTDCCTDRLSNFTAHVIDSNGTTTYEQTITEIPNPSTTINAGNVKGKIVKIQSNLEETALSLAEVEVFSSVAVLSTSSVDYLKKAGIISKSYKR